MTKIRVQEEPSWHQDQRAVQTVVRTTARTVNRDALAVWTLVIAALALFIAIVALFVANITADKLPASGESCIRANSNGQLYIGVCR